MVASVLEAIARGDHSFESLNGSMTEVCRFVNEKLQGRSDKSDLSVLESIAAMAIAGVSHVPPPTVSGTKLTWHKTDMATVSTSQDAQITGIYI